MSPKDPLIAVPAKYVRGSLQVTVSVLGHEPDGIRTDDQGHYKLKAHAAPGEEVRVTAERGKLRWSGYLPAGESVEIRLSERK